MLWTHGEEELHKFLNHLNTRTETIKFKHELSHESIAFLDTTVKKSGNTLHTDLYCKPTDSHSYLHYTSVHPKACRTSIPYSQFLRIRRICTTLEDYDKHAKDFACFFLDRGYPSQTITEAMIRARRQERQSLLIPNKKRDSRDNDTVILVTTYHPTEKTLVNTTRKNWNMLGKSPNTDHLFQKRLLIGYRRPKNLKDLLVRSTLRPLPENTTPGTKARDLLFPQQKEGKKQTDIRAFFPQDQRKLEETPTCSTSTNTQQSHTRPLSTFSMTNLPTSKLARKRECKNPKCRYCPCLNKTGQLTCTVTGANFYTMKNISCKCSNLIYSITCKTCKKQYVGQTKRTVMERFQGHFDRIKRGSTTDAVGQHFSRADHRGIRDVEISILTFLTLHPDSERALERRLKIEKSWTHRLRCPAPLGLNIFD